MKNSRKQSKKSIFNKPSLILLISIFFLNLTGFQSLPGQSKENEPEKDQKIEYPKKRKDRQTWEQILSFPGDALIFPFRMVFKGMAKVLEVAYVPGQVGAIYDFLHSDDGHRWAEPTYSIRSGGGLKFYQKNLLNEGSILKLRATAGLNTRQKYEISFTGLKILGTSIITDFLMGYRLMADESFYGIGPQTNEEDRSAFAYELSWYHLGLNTAIGSKISLASLFSLEHNNIYKSRNEDTIHMTDLYTINEIPGLETKVKMVGGQINIKIDTRDQKGWATSGQEIQLNLGVFSQIKNTEYGYWKMKADIKQYLHLFYRRTLALRIAGEMTVPFTGRTAPFYYLSELGTRETIRGFKRGRFRDMDMILGSIEYYYPIRKTAQNPLDTFLFLDVGQVSHDIFRDFDDDYLQVCGGIGLRLYDRENEIIRFMMGRSKEQFRVYLTLN